MPLTTVPSGIEKVAGKPGGLALDFVREMIAGKPMIQRSEMTLLPIAQNTAHFVAEVEKHDRLHEQKQHALSNAVVTLLNQAIGEHGSLVYAFGSAFADQGVTDGIHDIHMNQGNALNNHGGDNGIWQDGALFLYLPKENSYTAVFIAFQNESWHTDNSGNPAS